MGKNKEDRARDFSVVPRDRKRGSRHKLKYRKLHLNLRNIIFTVKVAKHWKRRSGQL